LERQEENSKKSITIGVLVVFTVSTLGVTLAFAEETFFDSTLVQPSTNSPEPNFLTNKGFLVGNIGDYFGALRFFDDALEQDPNHILATSNKAVALYELDRLDESLDWIEKTLDLDPNYPQALNNKGWFLIQNDKPEEALVFFDKALEKDPEYTHSLENKAVVLDSIARKLYESGNPEEALVWIEKALEDDPNATHALNNKVKILNEIGRKLFESGKPEEALIWYDKALEVEPNSPFLLNSKGIVLSSLGQNEEAISFYDRALEIDPEFDSAQNNKDLVLEAQEESETSWGPIIGAIVGGIIVSVIVPKIKKHHTQKLLKHKELFRRPSFFVQKIRWIGSNITFAVLFDNERILFVHAHKISKAPKDSSIDEILSMSEHNFQIPIDEITSIVLEENTEGPNGERAGILHVESEEYNGEFDINAGQDLQECQETVTNFRPTGGALSRH